MTRRPSLSEGSARVSWSKNGYVLFLSCIHGHANSFDNGLRLCLQLSIITTERVAAMRKDKRVRKLLREDLPASLRGRIWTFLLDASARRLPELYDQLVLISSISSEGRMQEDIAK